MWIIAGSYIGVHAYVYVHVCSASMTCVEITYCDCCNDLHTCIGDSINESAISAGLQSKASSNHMN